MKNTKQSVRDAEFEAIRREFGYSYERDDYSLKTEFLKALALKRITHHLKNALFNDGKPGSEFGAKYLEEMISLANNSDIELKNSVAKFLNDELEIGVIKAGQLGAKLQDAFNELDEAIKTGKIQNNRDGVELFTQLIFSVVAVALVIAGAALIAISLGVAPAALVAIAAGVGVTAGTTLTVAGTTIGVGVTGGAAVVAGVLLQGSLGLEGSLSLKNIQHEGNRVEELTHIKPFDRLESFKNSEKMVQNHLDRCFKRCRNFERVVNEIVKEAKVAKKYEEKHKAEAASRGSELRY